MKTRKNPAKAVRFEDLPDDAYLRANQLLIDTNSSGGTALLPFSRATLWRMVKAGTFPAPQKISAGVTVWSVRLIRRWLKNQTAGQVDIASLGKDGGTA